MREILENRAEIYRALNEEKDDGEEEEQSLGQDINLVEHLKLKENIHGEMGNVIISTKIIT